MLNSHRRTFSTDSFQQHKKQRDSDAAIREVPTSPRLTSSSESKRFSLVGKWFCDRLLRVKVPQTSTTTAPHTVQEDLISQLQSFNPISEGRSESDALHNVIKGCAENAHLAVGIFGHGSQVFLNTILETTMEDEITSSVVEHPRECSLKDIFEAPPASIDMEQVFLFPENPQNTTNPMKIVLKYGSPELFVEFKEGSPTSSMFNVQRKRIRISSGGALPSKMSSIREKLRKLQEPSTVDSIKSIEIRLPSSLLRGNREYTFYGSNATFNVDGMNPMLGEHCLVCVVDQEGLTLPTRGFLEQSGFLHKLIRHPQEYQIIFLMDETNLGEFTAEDFEAILRQQFITLLREHAPGPYSCLVPRLASTVKMILIKPRQYLTLNSNNGSKQQKQSTGLPVVLATLQNLAVGKCADAIKNISKDWISKAESPSTILPLSSPVHNSTQRSAELHNGVAQSLQHSFQGIKESVVLSTRFMDLMLARTAKQAYNDWSEFSEMLANSSTTLPIDALMNHGEVLSRIISQSLAKLAPNFQQQDLFQNVPQQVNTVSQLSSDLLSTCLHSSGALKTQPSDTDKVRVKRLAEFCQLVHKRTLQRVETIEQNINSVNIHQFIRDACQHVLISTSIQGSSFPWLTGDAFSNLPLKAAQRIRLQLTEVSTRTLSLLSDIEQDLCRSSETVLRVLQTSPFELQQKPLQKILSKSSPARSSSNVQFRPFTNLIFDTSDWALFSFLGQSLVPDNTSFTEQLLQSQVAIHPFSSSHGNGNSLFRALAHQMYGAEGLFPVIRFLICNEILENSKRYEPYFLATHCELQEYVAKMAIDGEPGDHVTLLAFANYYKVNVWIYSPVLAAPILVQSSARKQSSLTPPRAIAYMNGRFFCSLIPVNQKLSKKRHRSTSTDSEVPPLKRACLSAPSVSMTSNIVMGDKPRAPVPFKAGEGIISLRELCAITIANNVSMIPSLQGSLPLGLVQGIINAIPDKDMNDEVLDRLLDGLDVDSLSLSGRATLDYACCTVIARHALTIHSLNIDNCFKIPNAGFPLLLGAHATQPNSLDSLSLAGCAQLDNATLQLIALHSPVLRQVRLNKCSELRDTSVFDLLENCKQLSTLYVSDCAKLTDQSFTLSSAPLMLQDVDAYGCPNLTDKALISIATRATHNLQCITIQGDHITNVSLKVLADNCPNLRRVSISGSSITDEGVRYLSTHCRSLEALYLSASENITPLVLHPAQGTVYSPNVTSSFTNLKSLDLSYSVKITDTTLEAVAQWLPALEYLNVSGCEKISDRGLNQVLQHSCGSLQRLELERCHLLTDVSVVQIALSCQKLTHLSLVHLEQITDFGLAQLTAHCSQLQFLDISSCSKLTNEGFFQMNFPSLITLQMAESSVSDEVIADVLSRCPLLQKIDLSFCPNIGTQAMKVIERCTSLVSLDISYCNALPFSDLQDGLNNLINLQDLSLRGYLHLKGQMIVHKFLRSLNLSWCKNLQEKALKTITTDCPSLESLDVSWCSTLSLSTVQTLAPSLRTILAIGN